MVVSPETSTIISRAAPIGGLNFRDQLAAMPEGDAKDLINWVPSVGGLAVRKGYREWAVNFPSAVKSVFYYEGSDQLSFPTGEVPGSLPGSLFAATDTGIYDVTSTTSSPAVVQALSGTDDAGYVESSAFSNSAGSFIAVCSERDGYFLFDGSAWTVPVVTGTLATDFVQPLAWKRRLWFVKGESTEAWYLATDAIAGAATKFDFGPQFKTGGNLAFLASWTIDAGTGIDDLLVAVSSTGDVLVYKGTDPSSVDTFGLVGSWSVGHLPAGRRGYCQLGGDLLLLSVNGIFPLSYVTRGGAGLLQASGQEYSSKIRAAINIEMSETYAFKGWQLTMHPSDRTLTCSIPDSGLKASRQFALSTPVSGWAKFVGVPSLCTCVAGNYSFTGTSDNRVMLIFSGSLDNVSQTGDGGTPIQGLIFPAFGYFDSPAKVKEFLMIRPMFVSTAKPGVQAAVRVNFSDPPSAPVWDVEYPNVSGYLWGVGLWGQATWGGGVREYFEWAGVSGFGVSGAAYIKTLTTKDTTMLSCDYMVDIGGSYG